MTMSVPDESHANAWTDQNANGRVVIGITCIVGQFLNQSEEIQNELVIHGS